MQLDTALGAARIHEKLVSLIVTGDQVQISISVDVTYGHGLRAAHCLRACATSCNAAGGEPAAAVVGEQLVGFVVADYHVQKTVAVDVT